MSGRVAGMPGSTRGREKKPISGASRIGPALLFFCALGFCGCRSSPDMKPFSDATSQLATSIKIAGRTVVSEIESMSVKWKEPQRDSAMAIAAKFDREWAQRNALADVLLDYSASLTAIVEAGEQGEKSAKALAASFAEFTEAIDVVFSPSETLQDAAGIGAQLYGRFARHNAAKTLGEAMEKLQPSIDETARVLGRSLLAIENGLGTVRAQIHQNVEDEVFDGKKVTTHRNDLKVLWGHRETLMTRLESMIESRDKLAEELVAASDEAREKEFERLGSLIAALSSDLATLDISIKALSDRLAPFDAREAADRDRLTAEIALVHTVRDGLGDWAAAHSRLAAAALERRAVQVNDLVQTAQEVRDLIQTIRTMSHDKE